MQANQEDVHSSLELETKLAEDFHLQLKLREEEEAAAETSTANDDAVVVEDDQDEEEEEEDGDEDFTFVCEGMNSSSPIAAEDAFMNGQIRPVFPLFNQDLLLGSGDISLPLKPPVKKYFIETPDDGEEAEGEDIAAGPYCEWSKKAVQASPEVCKKSNSTGFSKIWRFKEFMNRSNSDGRDAFVFLNNSAAPAQKEENKVVVQSQVNAGEVVGKVVPSAAKKKGKKGESTPLSQYMKNKAKEEERRKSYLPYRPELVGFFTNVNGGMSRNVHPY